MPQKMVDCLASDLDKLDQLIASSQVHPRPLFIPQQRRARLQPMARQEITTWMLAPSNHVLAPKRQLIDPRAYGKLRPIAGVVLSEIRRGTY